MSGERSKKPGRPYRSLVFLAVQAVVLVIAVGAARRKLEETEMRRRLPPMRSAPVTVGPLYDWPEVVGDDQLQTVLYRLRPRLRGPEPKIYDVGHALRFWGTEARFRDPSCLSGREILDILTNHAKFAEVWGADEEPLLMQNAEGVDVRVKEGLASTAHVDHMLAGLAEVGVPLDFPIRTPAGQATVRSMLQRSLRKFSLNQLECEWSALAYALYLESGQPWVSSEGQKITFDRIADRLMRRSLPESACYGNHRLHVLVVFLRVDEQHSILSPGCRARVIRHLQDAVSALVESQHPLGYWDENWAAGIPPGVEEDEQGDDVDPLGSRLQMTGHILEWLALAPAEVLPFRDVVARAGQWLTGAVINMDDEQTREGFAFLTHVGRALALWRGHFPDQLIDSLQAEEL